MTSTHTGIVHQPRGQTTIEYLPLEEVRVNAWVVDGTSLAKIRISSELIFHSSDIPCDHKVSSRIVLTQTFYNPSDEPTGRAKYVFPLPANAAVCAFELELEDGSIIVGEVKEKEEAALTFTQAVQQGAVAALVERVTDDSKRYCPYDTKCRYRCALHPQYSRSQSDLFLPPRGW